MAQDETIPIALKEALNAKDFKRQFKLLEKQVFAAADNLEFEEAARLRDKLKELEAKNMQLS